MRWRWPVGGQLEVRTEQPCSPKGVNSSQVTSTPCPTLLPTAVKKHWPKTISEGAGLFDFYVLDHSPLREAMPGTQGKSPEAGTKEDSMEEQSFLTCSYWLTQPTFLYNPPGLGWRHCTQCPGLFLTNHQALVTNQEICPHRLPYTQTNEGLLSIEVSLLW